MNPQDAQNVFHAISGAGPWGLAIFLVLVNIATSYALFKFFAAQLASKEAIIKAFAEAWERQTDAFNRRTKAENARIEMDALQLASRKDLHEDLLHAANELSRRMKEDQADGK